MSNETTTPIKFSKEVTDFILQTGNLADVYFNNYYWFPFYFKQVGENEFELIDFKDLPSGLKRIIEQDLPTEENYNEHE